ncbi:MAG: amidohydrolase [Solobacterium sp.]|nr:amidohydrolase [Solobacterium sp.]
MDFLKTAEEYEEYIISCRRHLHRHPELSCMEDSTVRYICEQLDHMGIPYADVPEGGIFAWIGSDTKGKTILLRADIDALPIRESPVNAGGFPKSAVSETDGVSHACGHDCHTAVLLGAAKVLKQIEGELPGRVLLMFERGEEGSACLSALLRYAQDQAFHIDSCFAWHVDPALDTGEVGYRKGYIMAGFMGFEAKITGREAHGSQPERGRNPIDAFTAYYHYLQSLRMTYANPYEPMVFSIGTVHAGEAYNIIPAELTFSGSFRFFEFADAVRIREKMEEGLRSVCAMYDCTGKIEFDGPSGGVYNEPAYADLAREAVSDLLHHDVTEILPMMSSESFALTSAIWPGVFLRLGVRNEALGKTALNHSEFQDPDEAALKYGCALMCACAWRFLTSGIKIPERPHTGDIRHFVELYQPAGLKYFD